MTDFVVRDKRANNRFFIDNSLLRGGWGRVIGPYGLAIYSAIAMHADVDEQRAWPSHQLLADLTGMSRPSVIKALNQLEELGIIWIERKKNKPHTYYLMDQSQWKVVNEIDTAGVNEVYTKNGGVNDVDSGVNEVDTAGVNDVDSGVNDVYTNNTHITIPTEQDTNEQDTHGSAVADPAPEPETKPEQPETRTPAQAMFEALATACAWEVGLLTEKQRGQLNQTEKKLRNLPGQTVTPADVLAFGEWWQDHDWRGKQGEHPRPDQIRAEWGRFRYWQRQRAEAEAARQEAAENAERIRAAERQAETGSPELVAARRLWSDALAELELQIDHPAFTQWLEKTQAIGQDNGCLQVGVESERVRDWLENRLGQKIRGALKYISEGAVTEIEFIVGGQTRG